MSIITRGLGGGGGGFGARLVTYTVDLYAIAKPAVSFTADMVAGPPVPATQNSELFTVDLVIDASRSSHYTMDVLVVDDTFHDEGWGENYI